MVAGTKQRTGPIQPPQFTPETAGEPHIPFVYYVTRQAKQHHNVRKEKLGSTLSSELPLPHENRYQTDKLGKAIHTRQDAIKLPVTQGQISDKVQTPARKVAGGHCKGRQLTHRHLSRVLLALTNLT